MGGQDNDCDCLDRLEASKLQWSFIVSSVPFETDIEKDHFRNKHMKQSKRQVKGVLTSFIIFKCKDEPQWFDQKLIVVK